MPARQPGDNDPALTGGHSMTREQWLAYHVARAPRITPQQWAATLLLLRTRTREDRSQDDDDPGDDEKRAG